MCHSMMESHGKVMEFHMKSTVGALFMLDMSLFLSLLSAMWVSYPSLPPSPLPSALIALRLKLCIVFSFVFSVPCFSSRLSFGSTLMFSVVFLCVIVLTLSYSLLFSVLLCREANNDLLTTYSWKPVKRNDKVSCVCMQSN